MEHFTEYYNPLIPWVNRLRRVIFPDSGRWKSENKRLYSQVKEVLRDARDDPKVLSVEA